MNDSLKAHLSIAPPEDFHGLPCRVVRYGDVVVASYVGNFSDETIFQDVARDLHEKGVHADMPPDEVRWLTREARGEITSTDGMVKAIHNLIIGVARGSSYFAYPHREQVVRDFCDSLLREVVGQLNSDDLECLGLHANRDRAYDIAHSASFAVFGDVARGDVAERREALQVDLKRHRERQAQRN